MELNHQIVCTSCRLPARLAKQVNKSIQNNHSRCLSILYATMGESVARSRIIIDILNTLKYDSTKCFEYLFHFVGLRLPEIIKNGFIMSANIEFIEYVILYDSTFNMYDACKIAKKLGRLDILRCLRNMTYLISLEEESNLYKSLPSIRAYEPTYPSYVTNRDIYTCNEFLDIWILEVSSAPSAVHMFLYKYLIRYLYKYLIRYIVRVCIHLCKKIRLRLFNRKTTVTITYLITKNNYNL
jgi:hypothetical protein